KYHTQHPDDYALHCIHAVVGDSVATADDCLAVAKNSAKESVPHAGIPCRGHPRRPIAVIHGEYIAASTLAEGNVRERRIEDVSAQCGLLLGIEVIERVEDLIAVIVVVDHC